MKGISQDLARQIGNAEHGKIAPNSTVNDIIRYEGGEMSEDETIDFFQRLVTSGLAWSLQGSYGRTAARMIEAGVIHK